MAELFFQRCSVHQVHDVKRLEDGEDLNDALMDFFVKLGQSLIPCGGLEGGYPSVAYLGSLFYDVLRKGGVKDGRAGYANVANWAKRRLGDGGLFSDGVGALAVPVNEMLRNAKGQEEGKHWALALLLNPRGGSRQQDGGEAVSLVFLDSLARAEVRYNPPVRGIKNGGNEKYPVEVNGFSRTGFTAQVRFRIQGDGSDGPLPDPRRSLLTIGDRCFKNPDTDLVVDRPGDSGEPGFIQGDLDFVLDSNIKTSGRYSLDFGGSRLYPALPLVLRRQPTAFQKQVGMFLGGYLAKEWERVATGTGENIEAYECKVQQNIGTPDVPQQEKSNDCGYFILEQVLRFLQLPPDALRVLACSPADEVAALPWPSQAEVTRRKTKLRAAVADLFIEAKESGTYDVDALLKADSGLRSRIQNALWEGHAFSKAVEALVAKQLASHVASQPILTLEELEAMPTRVLRTKCIERGILPQGTIERADLLRALTEHLESLDKAKLGEEKATADRTAAAAEERDVKRRRLEGLSSNGNGFHASNGHGSSANGAATASSASAVAPPPAPAAAPRPTFALAELQPMPTRELRALCVLHRVLPTGAVERSHLYECLVALLARERRKSELDLAAASAVALDNPAGAADKKPEAKPLSYFLGSMKPNFTVADLNAMPLKTLRTLCMQHGTLPAIIIERDDLFNALKPLAISA